MTVIIEDSRQKRGKHEEKRMYFADQGIIVKRAQLPFGDYIIMPSIVVDTKQDIIEIAQNLCGNISERKRFEEEMKGAKLAGIEIVFLIEDNRFSCPNDLYDVKMKLHNGKVVRGEQLATAMWVCEVRYGCRFELCSPEEAGHRIIEILEGGK